jgi:DNA-binding NarL/FixJ family response regulator
MTEGGTASVLVADDHPILLQGLANLLGSDPRLNLRSTCSGGSEALAELRKGGIDIAVLDIGMPDMSGIEVARAVAAEGLDTTVILLTAAATDRQREEAKQLGVSMMFKDSAADELLELVRAKLNKTSSGVDAPDVAPFELTHRELEIASLVAEGVSNREIAGRLDVTEGTIKVHLHNIFTKAGLSSRTALAAFMLKKPNGGQ